MTNVQRKRGADTSEWAAESHPLRMAMQSSGKYLGWRQTTCTPFQLCGSLHVALGKSFLLPGKHSVN
jgi:hypothetical protein